MGQCRSGNGKTPPAGAYASVLNFSDREGALFGCWPERGSAAGRNGIRLQRWRSGVRDVTATTRPGGGWSTDCRCRTGEPVRCARLRCARPHMPCFASSSCSPSFVSSHWERSQKQLAYLMCSHVRGKKRKLPGRNSTRQWVPSSFVVASCWIVGICMTASLAA